ncbi:hypothetical protein HPB48_020176 [Haemaphysalis longicornis]|uniref:SAM domain-containing protein n=1 Tax=Haemaphysalis longicornis TaxID=44386 RepID=A0A9J6F8A3_HAELO|nr:hypothetical protein HPB48_020176 [Haemaphysalis longicornis]
MEEGNVEPQDTPTSTVSPAPAQPLRSGNSPLPGRALCVEIKIFESTPAEVIPSPRSWTSEEVASYMRSIPDGAYYAHKFRDQDIDGEALFLLTPDDLIRYMDIKLGPALKICDRINELREKL